MPCSKHAHWTTHPPSLLLFLGPQRPPRPHGPWCRVHSPWPSSSSNKCLLALLPKAILLEATCSWHSTSAPERNQDPSPSGDGQRQPQTSSSLWSAFVSVFIESLYGFSCGYFIKLQVPAPSEKSGLPMPHSHPPEVRPEGWGRGQFALFQGIT